MEGERKVVGVFGGSFAPVHEGHIGVACEVIRRSLADEVWMIPCRRNPLKETVALPDDMRLGLLRKAIAEAEERENLHHRLRLELIELSMPDPSFTWQTMEALRAKYPDYDFRLVIGADSYLNFTKWAKHDWLAQQFRPIVFPRPGYEIHDVNPCFTLMTGVREYDISSTRLRAQDFTPHT